MNYQANPASQNFQAQTASALGTASARGTADVRADAPRYFGDVGSREDTPEIDAQLDSGPGGCPVGCREMRTRPAE